MTQLQKPPEYLVMESGDWLHVGRSDGETYKSRAEKRETVDPPKVVLNCGGNFTPERKIWPKQRELRISGGLDVFVHIF